MENRKNSAKDIAQQVTFKNRDKVDDFLAHGKGIIFVSAHFGNWKLGGAALSSLITPVASIYKGFNRHESALKHMAKILKNNGSVLLIIDQSSKPKYGVSADFFGHKAYHSSTAAHLASKFNAPIVWGVYY